MGMIFVDYAWIINGRSFKFRLFSAILMIIKKGGDEHMRSKYQRLKFIEKYHLLPVIASIPALMLIVHILFPTLAYFIFKDTDFSFLALGVLLLYVTWFVDVFQYGLCLIYLAYRYLKSVRKREPLSVAFWMVNAFLCGKLSIFYISVYIMKEISASLGWNGYAFISNPIYVIFLLITGWCCSTKILKNDKLIAWLFLIFIMIIGGLLASTLVVNNGDYVHGDYFLIQLQLVWYAIFFCEILLIKRILDKPYLADKWIGWKKTLLVLFICIPLMTFISFYILFGLARY